MQLCRARADANGRPAARATLTGMRSLRILPALAAVLVAGVLVSAPVTLGDAAFARTTSATVPVAPAPKGAAAPAAASSAARAAAPAAAFSAAPAAAPATAPILVGTFQPDVTGGTCTAWEAPCPQTALRPTSTSGVWSLTLTVPAGDWRWRVAADGDAVRSIGVGTRVDGPDQRLQLSEPRSVTFAFDSSRLVATASTAETFAWAWQQPGACPQEGTPPPPLDPSAVLFDPDGDGIATAVVDLVAAGCLRVVDGPGSHAIDVATAGLAGRVVVAFDSRAGTATAYAAGPPAADGRIDALGLGHDSRDLAYRSPPGASPAGAPIRLRARTFHADATGVTLHVADDATHGSSDTPMTLAASGVLCAEQPQDTLGTCDWWEATITPPDPTTLHYRFVVSDGSTRVFLADDALLDGGRGAVSRIGVDTGWVITVYVPGTQPVPWLDGAVVYQVFPDRFRNGDPTNDARTSAPRYGWPPDASDRPVRRPWDALPDSATASREWFGGDLAGITRNLDYLKDLGVSVLYLNPIFSAASNHAYDTRDYRTIDPRFGDPAAWAALVKAADARGIHIVLDGVFNHVSADSPYFDRYGHFATSGACEAVDSPYRSWFTFTPLPGGSCAGPDGPKTMDYAGWSNLASLPVLNKKDLGVRDLVYAGADAVAPAWIRAGASGWRLDVMTDPTFGTDFWPGFRAAVKATRPDAAIVAEAWQRGDVLPKLRGDTADTTMNYRFRNAVTGYLGTIDQEGFPDAGATNQAAQPVRPEDPRDARGHACPSRPGPAGTSWIPTTRSESSGRSRRAMPPRRKPPRTLPSRVHGCAWRRCSSSRCRAHPPSTTATRSGSRAPTTRTTGARSPCSATTGRSRRRQTPTSMPGIGAWQQCAGRPRSSATGATGLLLANDRDRTLAFSRYDDGTGLAIVALNPDPEKAARIRVPLADARGPGLGVPDGVRFNDAIGASPTSVTSSDGSLLVDLPPLSGAILVPADPLPAQLAAPSGVTIAPAPVTTVPSAETTAPASVTIAPTAVPISPSAGAAAAVALRWDPLPGADGGYVVTRSPMPGGPIVVVGRTDRPTTSTSLEDVPPSAGTWWYTVRGIDGRGWVGQPSVETSVAVTAPPPPSAGPPANSSLPGQDTPGGAPGGPSAAVLALLLAAGIGIVWVALLARRRRRRA